MNRRSRDPVQRALHAIRAEIDFVIDRHADAVPELADALVEMGVGLGAERPARAPMSLASLGQRPEPEQATQPEPEPPSDVAALLQQMNNR